jgi:RNase adaptor protein for sRNA GlmZ degradation
MKLIVIYGPPAVGKLTVAKGLSKLTGYKILHNHLTSDIIFSLMEFGTDRFWKHIRELKNCVLNIALEEKMNVIVTICYAHKRDDRLIKDILDVAKKYNIKPYFVQLICDEKRLLNRVVSESRKKHGKLKNKRKLRGVLKECELFLPIPFVDSFTIDNTNISAKKAAKMIKEHYKL